jgi:hypothetical protein
MRTRIVLALILITAPAWAAPIRWDRAKEPCDLSTVCAVYWYNAKGKLPAPGPGGADFLCFDNGKGVQTVKWLSKEVPAPTKAQLDAIKATAATVYQAYLKDSRAEEAWKDDPKTRAIYKRLGKTKADFKKGYKKELEGQ